MTAMHVTAEVRAADRWKTISIRAALRTVQQNPLTVLRCPNVTGGCVHSEVESEDHVSYTSNGPTGVR